MGIKTVLHPLYSPNFTPCDFCLFPKLRGCRYETIEEMKDHWHAHTRGLPWSDGLCNRSMRVQTLVALLRSLSGKYHWERYEPTYPPCYGLNSTTNVLLGEWLWHWISYRGWYAIKQRNQDQTKSNRSVLCSKIQFNWLVNFMAYQPL